MTVLTTLDEVPVVFTSALLFGIYLSTLSFCLRWLLLTDEGWKLRRNIQWIILLVALLLFGCGLTNLSLVVRKLMLEIKNPSTVQKPLPPTGKPVHTWEGIVECTTANVSALAADAVLIWRCWLIYECSLGIIVFPVLMWISGFICSILQLYWQMVNARGLLTAWQPVNSVIGPGTVLTPFWASTILLNTFATVAITRKLMSVAKAVEGVISTRSLRFVSNVMAQSGVLYILITVAHFIVWFTPSSFAISLVSNINIPIIGITYNLIVIRTYQEKARKALGFQSSGRPTISSLHFTGHRTDRTNGQSEGTGSLGSTLAMASTEDNMEKTKSDALV